MPENDLGKSLALTLRHTFGEFLDLPLFPSKGEIPGIKGEDPASVLDTYGKSIRYCEKCPLHIGRQLLVFGRGHWGAKIAFVGDYPSSADDKSGEPFSDEAGQLLHKMILAMKVRPEEAYLTNLYKCRPPAGTRLDSSHFQACETHLKFQFTHVRAPVIIALGENAARALGRAESPLQVLRKQVFEWQGRKVIPTHHPRDLQLSPDLKKQAWEDLRSAMRLLELS